MLTGTDELGERSMYLVDNDSNYVREDIWRRDRSRTRRVLAIGKSMRLSSAWKAAAKKWYRRDLAFFDLIEEAEEERDAWKADSRKMQNGNDALRGMIDRLRPECVRLRNKVKALETVADVVALERDELRGQLAEAREVLREVVWSHNNGWCPVCHLPPAKGHLPGCQLAAVLKGE